MNPGSSRVTAAATELVQRADGEWRGPLHPSRFRWATLTVRRTNRPDALRARRSALHITLHKRTCAEGFLQYTESCLLSPWFPRIFDSFGHSTAFPLDKAIWRALTLDYRGVATRASIL